MNNLMSIRMLFWERMVLLELKSGKIFVIEWGYCQINMAKI